MKTPKRVPVLNARGEVVGDVSATATSVGASKVLLGASCVYRRDERHGWVWQEHTYRVQGTKR